MEDINLLVYVNPLLGPLLHQQDFQEHLLEKINKDSDSKIEVYDNTVQLLHHFKPDDEEFQNYIHQHLKVCVEFNDGLSVGHLDRLINHSKDCGIHINPCLVGLSYDVNMWSKIITKVGFALHVDYSYDEYVMLSHGIIDEENLLDEAFYMEEREFLIKILNDLHEMEKSIYPHH